MKTSIKMKITIAFLNNFLFRRIINSIFFSYFSFLMTFFEIISFSKISKILSC